jgi:hypothetical protein
VQASPARCSTDGRSHDEQAQVLGVATSTSAPIPLQDVQPLQDDMMAITSKPSPTCIHAQVVFDDMQQKSNTSRSYCFEDSQQKYINRCTHAYSNDVVFPCLATRMLDVQKWCDGMGAQKLAMLQTVSATLVDKGPRTYILNFEAVDISPKPPWPRGYLESKRVQSHSISKLCLNVWLWFTENWVKEQQRPPKQLQFQFGDIQLKPKPPWSLVYLEDDTSHSDSVIHNTGMIGSHLPENNSTLLTDHVPLRPLPWPSFTKDIVVVGNSPITLFCDISGWYLQHYLKLAIKCCWMQWVCDGLALMTMHQKKIQLIMVTVTSMQSLLQLVCPSLVKQT